MDISNLDVLEKEALVRMGEFASTFYTSSVMGDAIHYVRTKTGLQIVVKFYTSNNEYTVMASVRPAKDREEGYSVDDVYMAGYLTSRKQRAGETWQRGRDLPDGSLDVATWSAIMTAILRCEFEDIKSDRWKETYQNRWPDMEGGDGSPCPASN